MKPNFKYLALMAAVAGLFFSCKSEVKTPAAPTTPAAAATEMTAAAKPETEVFAALVNGLRLRETPDSLGKVAGQCSKGTLLFATGKRSDKKVSMPFGIGNESDYFYEVSMKGAGKAWAFGPAMTKVFAGKLADAPGDDFQKFAHELGKLPLNVPESGGKAYQLLKTLLPKGGDAGFFLMEKLFHDIVFDNKVSGLLENKKSLREKLESEGMKIWERTFDHQKYPETKRLADNGFYVGTTEGSYFPLPDLGKLKAAFAGTLSAPTAAFLDQEIIEDIKPGSSDGGIIIELDELVKRAIFWENWAAANPHHVYAWRGQNDAKWLASDVLIGENNTPVFEYEKMTVMPEAQKSWDLVLKDYPNSKLAAGIREMQSLVKADGGKRGPKTEELVKKMMESMN